MKQVSRFLSWGDIVHPLPNCPVIAPSKQKSEIYTMGGLTEVCMVPVRSSVKLTSFLYVHIIIIYLHRLLVTNVLKI